MKHAPYHIHFVCRGNTYRSRLAAAYMASKLDDAFDISSSGIATHANSGVPTVESYTRATAKLNHISYGLAGPKTQTSDDLLASADIIIFMNKDIFDEAARSYAVDARKSLVWHIVDMDPHFKQARRRDHNEQALNEVSERTFQAIRRQCDKLKTYLTHTNWVDVTDDQDRRLGLRLPHAWACDRGLWSRGIHVVVRTHDGKFVVGKRTSSIVFAPNMLEITLGGGVDEGETPLQAAGRETHEELGVRVAHQDFRPLFIFKQHSYHPRYKKFTRGYLYVYSVTLSPDVGDLRPQPGEVAELRLLSKRQIGHLLRAHRMKHFGQLKWDYKLYQKAVRASTAPALRPKSKKVNLSDKARHIR